jgi:hypothetical protein
MDDWHRRVAGQLVARTRARSQAEGDAELEIALGQARAAVAYVLEFARAHRVSVAGNLNGDDVWLQFGNGARVRCTLNRRDGHLVLRVPDQEGRLLRYGEQRKALVDGNGERFDVASAIRSALEGLVAEWSAHPSFDESARASVREFEDEPTKG